MSRTTETQPVNLFPVIALLILNLLAVLFTLGFVLARTAGLKGAPEKVAVTADRIGDIRLVENSVVFDLIDTDDSGANPEITKQITMPQEGFLGGFASMENFVDKMIEAGLVTQTESTTDED